MGAHKRKVWKELRWKPAYEHPEGKGMWGKSQNNSYVRRKCLITTKLKFSFLLNKHFQYRFTEWIDVDFTLLLHVYGCSAINMQSGSHMNHRRCSREEGRMQPPYDEEKFIAKTLLDALSFCASVKMSNNERGYLEPSSASMACGSQHYTEQRTNGYGYECYSERRVFRTTTDILMEGLCQGLSWRPFQSTAREEIDLCWENIPYEEFFARQEQRQVPNITRILWQVRWRITFMTSVFPAHAEHLSSYEGGPASSSFDGRPYTIPYSGPINGPRIGVGNDVSLKRNKDENCYFAVVYRLRASLKFHPNMNPEHAQQCSRTSEATCTVYPI